MQSSHLILCHPLLLLPSISPSIRVFSNESVLCVRSSKCWSFSFNISPSSEHPGLISFRMDCLDLLVVKGTLKSLLQHHSSKASTLQQSGFFIVQLSHPYMTTGKTIALTRRTFVGKVMSLLLNMLSRLVITFLPRNKCLLISWLQSPSSVILEPRKVNSATVSTVSPSICHEVMGLDPMILVLWMLSFKPTFSLSSFTFIKRFFSLEWVAFPFPRRSSQPRDWTQVPHIAGGFFTSWATMEAQFPKKSNAKECSNYCTIACISHVSKVMYKILQIRLQQYISQELPDVQVGVKKGRGTRDQIVNISWIMEKSKRAEEKYLLLFHWLCQSLWLCRSQQTGKFLRRW